MRSSSRWIAIIVVVPLIVSALPSSFAYAGEPTTADKDAAREAFAEGKELRQQKKYKASLLKFKAAYALVPSPITAIEVGRAQVLVGQLVEARETFLAAAAMPPKPDESSTAKVARVEARSLADDLAARIPSLVVKITGAGAGVSVSVDGRSVADGVAKIDVDPGKHQVVAKVAGSPDQSADVEVEEGESRDVVLKFSTTSTDTKTETTNAPTSGVSPLTYVGFGVAGAGVVVGSIFGVIAMGKRKGPPDGEEAYKSTATISTVSFAVAGAGAALGVIGLLTGGTGGTSEPTSGSAPSWHPWISVGGAGVSGSF